MSADNYIFVRKRDDGKFGVSMRFASDYYEDESSAEGYYPPTKEPEDWYGVFDTAEDALVAAHKAYQDEYVVEYGVVAGEGVV